MKKYFTLVEAIKTLVSEQRRIRPQRKSSYEGVRDSETTKYGKFELDHNRIAMKMLRNSEELRRMNIALGLLRGKTYLVIEPKVKDCKKLDKFAWQKIDAIMEKHKALHDAAMMAMEEGTI